MQSQDLDSVKEVNKLKESELVNLVDALKELEKEYDSNKQAYIDSREKSDDKQFNFDWPRDYDDYTKLSNFANRNQNIEMYNKLNNLCIDYNRNSEKLRQLLYPMIVERVNLLVENHKVLEPESSFKNWAKSKLRNISSRFFKSNRSRDASTLKSLFGTRNYEDRSHSETEPMEFALHNISVLFHDSNSDAISDKKIKEIKNNPKDHHFLRMLAILINDVNTTLKDVQPAVKIPDIFKSASKSAEKICADMPKDLKDKYKALQESAQLENRTSKRPIK